MAIKINFDTAHNPEMPTIVLAKKNGDKIGQINAKAIEVSDSMNDGSDIIFNVHKYIDGEKCYLWEQIVDFKLIHCVEWDMWFEISVELNQSNDTIKTVFCKRLGQAELSQIMLYDIEINTENDIARDDYVIPTVFYNIEHPEASLLHRIMEKAKHYTVIHVDTTIANIQRTFSFSDISIYDAFQKIAEEIGLNVAAKPDSQDICFVPDNDYAAVIRKEAADKVPKPGNFVTTDGKILGQHKGIIHYTVGQRKGLNLAMGHPVFVTQIRPETNEVVIGEAEDVFTDSLLCNQLNFMAVEDIQEPVEVIAKIRYSHSGSPCTLEKQPDGTVKCSFHEPVRAVTPGQAVVFYKEDYVYGGGTIIR